MNYITITKAEAEARRMEPVTAPQPRDSEFLASVINDMRKVPGTCWALVHRDPVHVQDNKANNTEVWRVPITSMATTQIRKPTL